ncbi:hypothetical protein CPC08DRAFT_769837 [Agrocybe pediades]|nr:hypothetical protein CPC08DRAFT_769837 [Agrocybe pediades]
MPPVFSATAHGVAPLSKVARTYQHQVLCVHAAAQDCRASNEEAAQMKNFIISLVPYYKKAKALHQLEDFIGRVFIHWRLQWPLKPERFENDSELMDFIWVRMVEKSIRQDLVWADTLYAPTSHATSGEMSWEEFMDNCDAERHRMHAATKIRRKPAPIRKRPYAAMTTGGRPPPSKKPRQAEEIDGSDVICVPRTSAGPSKVSRRKASVEINGESDG